MKMINNNIVRFELINNIKQTLLWSSGISILIFVSLSMYSTMLEQGAMDQLEGMMQTPIIANMMEAFGMDFESLKDILGFYVSRNIMFSMIMGSIFAILLTANSLSKEESEKTIEYLFTKPLTRETIFISKFISTHILILLLNIIITVIGYIGLEIFKTTDYSLYSFIVLCVYTYLLMLFFASAGYILAAFQKRGRVAVGLLIGLVLGTYFWDIISKILSETEFIGWFTPYKYVDLQVLRPDYGFEFYRIAFFVSFIFIFSIISYHVYRKKNYYI
jgi:ABC-2 type transport system permease protein